MTEENPVIPEIAWQIEYTHQALVQSVKDALGQIYDPELRLNILELGLVRDVAIEGDTAKITMILTTPFCPYGPALLETARVKAEEALNLPTTIELGKEAWLPTFMAEELRDNWGLY